MQLTCVLAKQTKVAPNPPAITAESAVAALRQVLSLPLSEHVDVESDPSAPFVFDLYVQSTSRTYLAHTWPSPERAPAVVALDAAMGRALVSPPDAQCRIVELKTAPPPSDAPVAIGKALAAAHLAAVGLPAEAQAALVHTEALALRELPADQEALRAAAFASLHSHAAALAERPVVPLAGGGMTGSHVGVGPLVLDVGVCAAVAMREACRNIARHVHVMQAGLHAVAAFVESVPVPAEDAVFVFPAARAAIALMLPDVWALEVLRRFEHVEDAAMAAAFTIALGHDAAAKRVGSPATLMYGRRRYLCESMAVHYSAEPLVISRGVGVYLHGHDGVPYIDCVNNVCHVGHCHPAIVDAITAQAKELNTNTRYLHPNVLHAAERLLRSCPAPLSDGVVFFTGSGSEANELALRLAAVYTGGTRVAALDDAYHGNTSTLVEISSYHGKAGGTTASWVTRVPRPDYRRRYELAEVDAAISPDKGPWSCAIVESIGGCMGHVFYPPGFLKRVYAAIRRCGGVAIADEVQCGLWRVGSHCWAFELDDGAVPDIVTIGKPLGNGHPVAAVIVRRDIAHAFHTKAPEYFNTFGGNPVSCAAAAAVFDTLQVERRATHAERVGTLMLQLLRDLARTRPCIGDVRGRGLFIGVELVVPDTPDARPATAFAAEVAARMRHRGVLVTPDGPGSNVLKIKPPMCFSEANARYVAYHLGDVLDIVAAVGFTLCSPCSSSAAAAATAIAASRPPKAPTAPAAAPAPAAAAAPAAHEGVSVAIAAVVMGAVLAGVVRAVRG